MGSGALSRRTLRASITDKSDPILFTASETAPEEEQDEQFSYGSAEDGTGATEHDRTSGHRRGIRMMDHLPRRTISNDGELEDAALARCAGTATRYELGSRTFVSVSDGIRLTQFEVIDGELIPMTPERWRQVFNRRFA